MLSGTRRGYELDAGPVHAVIDAGRRGAVSVVCDLPRRLTDATQAALNAADLVVVVSRCDVRACAATGALAPVLASDESQCRCGRAGPVARRDCARPRSPRSSGLPLLAVDAEPQPHLAEQLTAAACDWATLRAGGGGAPVLGVLPARPAAMQNGRAA